MNWVEFERFGQMMQRAPWRFAKTSPRWPHHYTLREHWTDDAAFTWAAEYIREAGYQTTYLGEPYLKLDVNEHSYWTMGAPIPDTILINRARRREKAAYDAICYKYDTLFRDSKAAREEAELLAFMRSVTGKTVGDSHVLDIGCGTGLLLRLSAPRSYVGIDPSAGMLGLLRHRHPNAAVVHTDLARYVPAYGFNRYDLVVALFGVGSYLTDAELERIPTLLTGRGAAVVMFYRGDRKPLTYEETRVTVPHRPWNPETLPGEAYDFTEYQAVVVRP